MTESKIVYVNDDYDSDQDNAIIYGGTAQEKSPTLPDETPPSVETPTPPVETPTPPTPPVETPTPPTPPAGEEGEEEGEEVGEEEGKEEDEEEGEEGEEGEEEGEEDNKEADEKSDGGSMFGGGDGYRSEPDDASSVSSLDTDAILNVDPLYFRLTKFLQTGGSEPENVAEILKKINTNLEHMNQNLMNLMNVKSSQ